MKLTRRQITLAALLALALLSGLAYFQKTATPVNGAVAPTGRDTEDAFIDEARELQEVMAQGAEAGAALPPVQESKGKEVVGNWPLIELETNALDMGEISNSDISRRKVKVYNRGKTPLILHDVSTSCQCTRGVVQEDGKSIAPGGEGHIEVIVNPSLIHSFESSKTLVVFSNDPKNARVALVVSAKLNPEFILDPPNLNLGTVKKGESVERTILIRQNTAEEFLITGATLQRPGDVNPVVKEYSLELIPRPEAEWQTPGMKEYEVFFKSDPMLPLGAYKRFFYLTTNLRRLPFYAYKVEAVVESFYTLDPSYPNALTLTRPAGSRESVTGVATLQSAQAISVSDLKYDEHVLKVVARPGDKPGVVYLEATLNPIEAGAIERRVEFTVKGESSTVTDVLTVVIYGDGPPKRRL